MASSAAEKKAEKLRLEGNKHFERGDFAAAIQRYTDSLDLHKTAVTYSNRAQANLNLKRSREACKDASAALDLDSQSLKAQRRYILALIQMGRKPEALLELENYQRMQENVHDYSIYQLIDTHALRKPPFGEAKATKGPKLSQLGCFEDDFHCLSIQTLSSDMKTGGYTSFGELQVNLSTKVHARIEYVWMNNVKVSAQMMDCLRAFDPICWSGQLELKYAKFGGGRGCFDKLFGGILQPYKLYLGHVKGLDSAFFFRALNRLSGLRCCDSVNLNSTHVRGPFDVEDVVEFLHFQPPSGMPRQRSLTFGQDQLRSAEILDVQLFNILSQKFLADTRPRPYLLSICGTGHCLEAEGTRKGLKNERTKEFLTMGPARLGIEILRGEFANYV